MADTTTTNINDNQINPVQNQQEGKKPLFGGSQDVFDNLEKFEKISNPTNGDFNFDFGNLDAEEKQIGANQENSGVDNMKIETEKPGEESTLNDFNFDEVVETVGNADDNIGKGNPITQDIEEGRSDQYEMNGTKEKNEETADINENDEIEIQSENDPVDKKENNETENYDFNIENMPGTEGSLQTESLNSAQENPQDGSLEDIPSSLEGMSAGEEIGNVTAGSDDFVLDTVIPQTEDNLDDSAEENNKGEDAIPSFDFDSSGENSEDNSFKGKNIEETETLGEGEDDTGAENQIEEPNITIDENQIGKEIGEKTEENEKVEESEEEKVEESEEVEEDEEERTAEEKASIFLDTDKEATDLSVLMKQYKELLNLARTMVDLEKKIAKDDAINESEIIGNNTEKSMIRYMVSVSDEDIPSLIINRIEKDYAHDEETEHKLEFTSEENDLNLIVKIDEFKLYEEILDLKDPVKQLQVGDKLKKFSFLFQGKISDLEEKLEEIKEAKEKMKAFRDIFRNF